MLPGCALVAAAVVPGQPCHQLLGILGGGVLEELAGPRAAQDRRASAVVFDVHLVTADVIGEAFRGCHDLKPKSFDNLDPVPPTALS